MEYEHNKILEQGNGGVKSIRIKKKYVHKIKFERTSVNFNICDKVIDDRTSWH